MCFFLNQAVSKGGDDVSSDSGSTGQLPLLTDLVLYYCRHADQPVLLQLYQAEVTHTRAPMCALYTNTHRAFWHVCIKLKKTTEHFFSSSSQLTLAGGERKREVFLHSLELGHTAGTRAVKAMGESNFGLDKSI